LNRDNAAIRVWRSPLKEATSAILLDNNEKTWSLADEAQRKDFEEVKNNLWVEGCASAVSGLSAQYYYHADKYTITDWVKFTLISATCGRQPTPIERMRIHNACPDIVDCEWSITAEPTPVYNCIAWSVGETNVFYDSWKDNPAATYTVIGIDQHYGDGERPLTLKEVENFYNVKGFELLPDSEGSSPRDADVIYFDGFHAAKKMVKKDGSPCPDGAGKWIMFESKLGKTWQIEHVWGQVSGPVNGSPVQFYKKVRKK